MAEIYYNQYYYTYQNVICALKSVLRVTELLQTGNLRKHSVSMTSHKEPYRNMVSEQVMGLLK